MPTPMLLPPSVTQVMDRLYQAGYTAFVVGGCVRDHLMGIPPHDFDMTTSATPEEMKQVFSDMRVIETGIRHGTLTVLSQGEPVEVTTYRIDGGYRDHRHPDSVTYTDDLREDLRRRDFTINAIAYSPALGYQDPFSGMADLEAGLLRAVGDPDARFEEDALRILRAIRFSSVLGFPPEEETEAALYRKKDLLSHVSPERIREEMTKLLLGDHVESVLSRYPAIIAVPLPEIAPMVACGQNSVYHLYSVWEHTLRVVGGTPKAPRLRWAALLHDIGKPASKFVGEDGKDHFYGHPSASHAIAEAILRRLKFDTKSLSHILALVLHHDDRPPAKRLKLLRLLSEMDYPLLYDLLDLTWADSHAQNTSHPVVAASLATAIQAKEMLQAMEQEGVTYRISHLALSGDDLLRLGFPRGKQIGDTLQKLLGDVQEGRVTNTKDALSQRAMKCYL